MSDEQQAPGRTVVGVDGSAGSERALDWAFLEAADRGGSVHVVSSWQHPLRYAGDVWGLGMDPSAETGLVHAAEAEAVRLVDVATRDRLVATTTAVAEGHPAQVLVDAVTPGDLLVVGSRGHGGFVGALIGSVSQHLVTHACCPVVVVPDGTRR